MVLKKYRIFTQITTCFFMHVFRHVKNIYNLKLYNRYWHRKCFLFNHCFSMTYCRKDDHVVFGLIKDFMFSSNSVVNAYHLVDSLFCLTYCWRANIFRQSAIMYFTSCVLVDCVFWSDRQFNLGLWGLYLPRLDGLFR